MIDVQAVLKDTPHFDTFCSVAKLHQQVETLRSDPRFRVADVGTSVNGVPIHHVCFGEGSIRALFVGFQHCMEPMNGLTIYSLIHLLQRDHPALANQGVEWHFVPCIDPDGAKLNEGWSQKPFTFANYMRNFHQQILPEQVDTTFPVNTSAKVWDKPSQEARVLMGVLDRVRPDFFYPGHDSRPMNGSWHYIHSDIDPRYYRQLSDLLAQMSIPRVMCTALERGRRWVGDSVYRTDAVKPFSAPPRSGVAPQWSVLSKKLDKAGVTSFHYLAQMKPEALIFVTELTNIRYVGGDVSVPTGDTRRSILLHVSAENKIVAGAILDEWDKVKADLDRNGPFYRKIATELIEVVDEIPDGLVHWYETPIRTLVADPFYSSIASRGEWLDAMIGVLGRFGFLCQAYEFVRLLKVSKQTPAVRDATARLEALFDAALADIDAQVDFSRFEPVDCTTLAKAHAGSALIVLNSLLEAREASAAA
jgi:hypothetical protein